MNWIFLSHALAPDTPLYGAQGSIAITRTRCIDHGDTSNSGLLAFPGHAGTHVDAPFHFDVRGRTLDSYPAAAWFVSKPFLIDLRCEPEQLVTLADAAEAIAAIPDGCDMVLIRTAAERWRGDAPDVYAMRGPGIAADLAAALRSVPGLRFVGLDCISLSSFAHREEGRRAHRELLGPRADGADPVMIVEDMALAQLDASPHEMIVAPLRHVGSDGAPATVLARIGR